jgi:hypothetical protein
MDIREVYDEKDSTKKNYMMKEVRQEKYMMKKIGRK